MTDGGAGVSFIAEPESVEPAGKPFFFAAEASGVVTAAAGGAVAGVACVWLEGGLADVIPAGQEFTAKYSGKSSARMADRSFMTLPRY